MLASKVTGNLNNNMNFAVDVKRWIAWYSNFYFMKYSYITFLSKQNSEKDWDLNKIIDFMERSRAYKGGNNS